MKGGEVFIPKLPSARIVDMAEAFAPGAEQEVIGLRGVEKLSECLVSVDEAPWCSDLGDRYAIVPVMPFWSSPRWPNAQRVPDGWSYTSANNDRWLTVEELRGMAG
jgi:UDP-N-acetylglucosamine 4,6-dehydratase